MITIDNIKEHFSKNDRSKRMQIGIVYYIFTNGVTKDKKQAYKIDAISFDTNDKEKTDNSIKRIENDERFYAWCIEEKGQKFLRDYDKEIKESWRKIILMNANTPMNMDN